MTNTLSSTQEKPHHLFFHSEALRSLGEMLTLPLSLPLLQRAPKGDGHTVMVIPGFTADDSSTRALRKFLISQGYDARGWDLGVNLGVREEMFERCLEHAQALHAHSGEKITLIGQSLGGIYA
ncbi:MAG: hypothetical protein NWP69_02835, partial [Congregibacter sp.]|nr:hypothetical protein [Congregibacter sp.]